MLSQPHGCHLPEILVNFAPARVCPPSLYHLYFADIETKVRRTLEVAHLNPSVVKPSFCGMPPTCHLLISLRALDPGAEGFIWAILG